MQVCNLMEYELSNIRETVSIWKGIGCGRTCVRLHVEFVLLSQNGATFNLIFDLKFTVHYCTCGRYSSPDTIGTNRPFYKSDKFFEMC